MRFHLITIFPNFFAGPLDYGVVARARQSGRLEVRFWDLREFTSDRHRSVDDRPFGGGEGMLLKIEPVYLALEKIAGGRPQKPHVVLLSAQGRLFDQTVAERLSRVEELVLICGRYEGVDERVAEHLADEELSIGNFVLSGGELPAAMVVDAVTRLLPGVLGNEASAQAESFARAGGGSTAPAAAAAFDIQEELGILDCPQYTRPADFRGWAAPEVLQSGDHAEVRRWRRRAALEKTLRQRPDLLKRAALSDEDREVLEQLRMERSLS